MAVLAGAAGGVDKRCHIVVRGKSQLPEIFSTLTTVLNWKLPIHTYFDIWTVCNVSTKEYLVQKVFMLFEDIDIHETCHQLKRPP